MKHRNLPPVLARQAQGLEIIPVNEIFHYSTPLLFSLTTMSTPEKPSVPSLLSTAKLAYKLTSQDWSQIGKDDVTSDLNDLTEQILAVMLIRLLAIVYFRSRKKVSCACLDVRENGVCIGDPCVVKEDSCAPPQFLDLSCTTICRTIIAQSEGFLVNGTICGRGKNGDYINANDGKGSPSNKDKLNLGLTGSIHECSLKEKPDISIRTIPSGSCFIEPSWPKDISEGVIQQLRMYIYSTLDNYNNVHYHNCRHAYHVLISANKLLDLMLCSQIWPAFDEESGSPRRKSKSIHWPVPKPIRPTYGIKDNPLSHFALLFSALVHDVEHTGVSNRQLVLESDELAILYNDQSVAEQRSLSIAFKVINKEKYKAMRTSMFGDYAKGEEEKYHEQYREFRKVVIDLVLCTDIASPERMQIVKSAWKEAFVDIGNNASKPPKVQSDQKISKGSSFDDYNKDIHISSPAFSVLYDEDEGDTPLVQKFFEARYSLAADLNQNSKPMRIPRERATLGNVPEKDYSPSTAVGKDASQPIEGESDISTGDEGDNDDDGRSTGSYFSYTSSIEMESSEELFLPKPSRKRHSSATPLSKLPSAPAVLSSDSLDTSVAPPPQTDSLDTSVAQPPPTQPCNQELNKTTFFGRVRKKKGKIKSLVSRSAFGKFRARKKASSASQEESSSTCTLDTKGKRSQESELTNESSRSIPLDRMMRRNSAPGGIFYDRLSRKKFRFRLGIRRALDLTGNTIEAFGRSKYEPQGRNCDEPDCLKASVVLQQMLKAADVAANMQVRISLG